MIFKRLILILFITISSVSAYGNDELNYESKSIKKIFVKYGIEDQSLSNKMALPDSTVQMNSEAGAFFSSYSLDSNCTIEYIYIGRVNSCRTGSCSVDEDLAEYFDYIILFNKDKSVVQVKIFNYQATHGQEITAKSWLKQFIGYQGQKKLKVNKNIDSISGATISTYAITEDINKRSAILLGL